MNNRNATMYMLARQDEFNSTLDKNWRKNLEHQHHIAIVSECNEILDHLGWKWWSKKEMNLAQIHLEIVDIWHFGMSILLKEDWTHGHVIPVKMISVHAEAWEGVPVLKPRAAQIRSCTRQLSLGADLFKHFDLDAFFYLMHVAGMTYEDLYVMWMGKVTLNKFRQDNGYKEGTYIKTWDGGEDNVHLTAILKDLRSGDAINPAPENFESRVYNLLEEDYAVVKAG